MFKLKKSEEKKQKSKNQKDLSKKPKINSNLKFTILAIILIAIFSIALTPKTLQNDTFYTIKIGEHIINNGINMQDPFSWHQNLPYTYPHWLYDVITYMIYNTFGMSGIYLTTCLISATLGISIYLVGSKLTKNKAFTFAITIGVMYVLRGYIAARAQLVTFTLFIWTIYFIEKFLETKKKRYAAGLIIIPIAIANLHLAVFPFYFILYLPYIGEYIIAILAETIIYKKIQQLKLKIEIKALEKSKKNNTEKIQKQKEQQKQLSEKVDRIKIKRTKNLQNPYKIKIVKNKNVKWLILVMIICLFTGLLTPLGTTPYTYLYNTMQGTTTQNINEHLPMTLATDTDAIVMLILILAILIFTKTKIRLNDLFMLSGLCYLMIATRRQITMFAIIGSVAFSRLIYNLLQNYDKKELDQNLVKTFTTKIGITLITILVLLGSYQTYKDKIGNTYIDEATYPVKACDYILENIDLSKAKFYNEYNYGSYMLYRGIPVFIDSRADLYAPEFNKMDKDIFMDFIDVSGIGTYYEDTFEKYKITHVILYKNAKINMLIQKSEDKNYKKLYSDENFIIYERMSH